MATLTPEDHERLQMELVTFAKEELDRRKKAPIYVSAEDVESQFGNYYHVHIVDPRIGFNQKTFRFWKGRISAKRRNTEWKSLGHRHTVEAVIYFDEGEGYSVIDGVDYHWKPGDFHLRSDVRVAPPHRHQRRSDGPSRRDDRPALHVHRPGGL